MEEEPPFKPPETVGGCVRLQVDRDMTSALGSCAEGGPELSRGGKALTVQGGVSKWACCTSEKGSSYHFQEALSREI